VLLKADINTVTILGQKLWHSTTSIHLTDLEVNYIKNINEAILCSVKANPLPINFACLITENLTINKLTKNVSDPVIKFLSNLNFDTKTLISNVKYNPLSPDVTVYLRNYKEWFLDIHEIELMYDECDCITVDSYPDWQFDILGFQENPHEFRIRNGRDIARYLEEKGYGIIDFNKVYFEEVEYVHYE